MLFQKVFIPLHSEYKKEANNCSLLSFWCNCSNNLCARLIQPRLDKKA